MAITPHTDLYLLKCPLESDNLNQLTFNSRQEQISYFASLPHQVIEDITYQRRDNVIRYPEHIDSIDTYNYVMYKNDNYTNKWFFAFITNMRYINDNMTEITIKTDVYQTWLFEMDFKRSFIEREHTNNDTIGTNTVPEGVELGEYVSVKDPVTVYNNPLLDYYICMAVTDLPQGSIPGYTIPRNYNGIYSGLIYLVFTNATDVDNAIKIYDAAGQNEYIQSIFMVPNNLQSITDGYRMDWTGTIKGESITTNMIYIDSSFTADYIQSFQGEVPNYLSGNYNPKNKKLLTYPYSCMTLTNNSGTEEVFRYEEFDFIKAEGKNLVQFEIYGAITPGMSMKAIPDYYKGLDHNYNYGIIGGKLPVCSWNSDTYTNWLTQNGVNNIIGIAGGGLSIASSIFTGQPLGIASGILGIANSIGEKIQHSIVPNQSRGNQNAGDINFSYSEDGAFTLHFNSIKPEYAHIIDDYFSMYGYKTNRVKLPNLTGRQNWNYVKTIGANIEGNLPQADIEELKSIFNNGVTLWHNPSTYLDYSQSNPIV